MTIVFAGWSTFLIGMAVGALLVFVLTMAFRVLIETDWWRDDR